MIPIFVYGTLRPGFKLYELIRPAVMMTLPAEAQGALYHIPSSTDENPVYPVADFTVEGSYVYGDLLWVDSGTKEFEYVNAMECSAGYQPVEVEIEIDEYHHVTAHAYHYAGPYGPQIQSGDWATCHTT